MPAETSAGVLLYRMTDAGVEVLIAHPGGPLWVRRDEGAWSIPKGLVEVGEDPRTTAVRELREEVGAAVSVADLIDLGETRLKSGKVVLAFAARGDLNVDRIVSNTFEMEWPPRSGQRKTFPEVDRAMWAVPDEARRRLNPAQVVLVDRLLAIVSPLDRA